jgi:hypothetical protein
VGRKTPGLAERHNCEEPLKSVEQLVEIGRTFDQDANSIRLARELLRIRDRNGYESPLIANAAQAAFEKTRGRHNIVLKARQMGMTTWIAGRFFLKTITARGVLTVQVAHTREAAESIFRMVQRFYDCLPEDVRKGPLKRSRANVRQMVFPELDSEFRVLSAADENSGRGLTVQNMHLSELSRWPGDAAATLAGLRAALTPTGELIMESTPNGASGAFYEQWQQAPAKGTVRHFFPWWLEPAYVSNPVTDLTEDESELMHQHNLSAEQIGYRRTLDNGYRNLRAQEFAEDPDSCFLTSGECCFDADTLQRRLKEAGEPAQTRLSGALRIWFPPMPDTEYIVAVDPAGGGPDGDFAAIQVIDIRTGVQCAELQQRLAPLELAERAAELGREYRSGIHPALLAIERNNHGHGVIAHLREARYPQLYEQHNQVGWVTNAATKPEMIATLGSLLVTKPDLFRSRALLEECRTFVTRPGGGAGAASGAHDDLVMSMALAHSVRTELKRDRPGL